MTGSRQAKLFAFPLKLSFPNGYWDRLYGGLMAKYPIRGYNNDFFKLFFSFSKPQIVHIHWPNVIYSSRYEFLKPVKLIMHLFILLVAVLRQDRLIWTFHNYGDHEKKDYWYEKISHHFLMTFSKAIVVHTEAGKKYLYEKYNLTKIVIIPQGNYVDFHGKIVDSPDEELLNKLNLKEEDKIFLCLGSIRPYKGIEKIINMFNTLPDDYKLIIAGKPLGGYMQELRKITNKNVIFYPRLVAGDDIPKFFSLPKFSVFDFNEVLTSASVVLSLSYAVPVIVPNLGDLSYIITDNLNGYKFNNDQELKEAIIKAGQLSADEINRFKRDTLTEIVKTDWNHIINLTAEIYKLN